MTILPIKGPNEQPAEVGVNPAFELSSEAHHRIANHLALIASIARTQAERVSQSFDIPVVEFRSVMEGLAANIDAAARLHRKLSDQPHDDKIEARTLIEELCRDLQSAILEPKKWRLHRNVAAYCMLRARQVIPVSVIITELVTNAVKYAHPSGVPGEVCVEVKTDRDGALSICVSDDGVGLPQSFNTGAGARKGLVIVRALAKELNGAFSVESNELGTVAQLVIPRTALTIVGDA